MFRKENLNAVILEHNIDAPFVQQLEYKSDGDWEYPKYPIETLYDKGGDCEDTSLLLCGIIRSMGYGSVLVLLDGHCAVGVQGGNLNGRYYELDGKKYFYVETTAKGWRIGEMPAQYINSSAWIWGIV